jgi:hypothetical protein
MPTQKRDGCTSEKNSKDDIIKNAGEIKAFIFTSTEVCKNFIHSTLLDSLSLPASRMGAKRQELNMFVKSLLLLVLSVSIHLEFKAYRKFEVIGFFNSIFYACLDLQVPLSANYVKLGHTGQDI